LRQSGFVAADPFRLPHAPAVAGNPRIIRGLVLI
jgi:hypothetical protein